MATASQPLKLLPEAVEGAEPAIFIPGSWQTAPQQESGDRSEEMLAQVAEAAATLASFVVVQPSFAEFSRTSLQLAA